ncbi:MAG TPA: archaeosortase/exosortase family protein, partial [Flavisolibacter sp.]|nr:archaeosortase/exosortase family protein [Flavisolibacter sp.]
MLAFLPQQVRRGFVWQGINGLFPLWVLLPAGFLLHDYLKDSLPVLVAGMAAMITTTVKTPVRNVNRFAIAAAILFVLTWLVPVNTLLYFAIGFLLFYWAETLGFRMQVLGVMALFLCSPAFQYAAGAFSFPIRMHLASVVGAIFSRFASQVQINGNTILYEGHEFAVDPACMGLHMLSLSLLLGIFLLGMMQKKTGKRVSTWMSFLFLCALFLLNLVANVLRILLLVQFAIPPKAVMHDIIGLLCLLLYVCVPACALAQKVVLKANPVRSQNTVTK